MCLRGVIHLHIRVTDAIMLLLESYMDRIFAKIENYFSNSYLQGEGHYLQKI